MEEVEVVGYPKPLTGLELLMESFGGTQQEQNILAGTPFKSIGTAFGNWNASETGKVYARMPHEIIIR